ncbi:hypothetical protein [Pseudodesulfovibrio indicus]|uniref:Uncharacterized protein n=1 Tax=Pseudodesulfovibrio indicus TaxID=1716143 RepID=A0A140D8W2_9BACT|nr:hypothetical protein [Pseudodesulfovibrio indicus]AMK09629.1 hypothetical protein AWY79_00150 [Pseudodesulfovibrio indicus]TDT86423.1 hypothetical protein EDC59_11399 [Pseudodesulfovibrio indicus]
MHHKPITVADTLQMQRMRQALALIEQRVITDADLRTICPRPDDRANLVALLLAGGFVAATLYPVNPGSEAKAHG